ncbi:MAG: molybdopterin-guanine dinucleotide biosynthesis protein B [Mariprofundales bacterium]
MGEAASMTVPILSIVGYSNAGKTTLLEKLIAQLSKHGLRIATIKHSHHKPELDEYGKDSWRHKQAGAETSFLVGSENMMMVADIKQDLNPTLLVSSYCVDFDLILVEGYSLLPLAKIEVLRAEQSEYLRCDPADLLAVVTDVVNLQSGLTQIELNDIKTLVNFILNWMQERDSA